MAVVILAGAAGQVRVWASDRGFWNDELSIAENLRLVSFPGLAGPLLYRQVAPPGWLMGEKALFELFGGDEQILKLPQLLSAVSLLCLTAFVAYRAVGRWPALIAASMIALSPLVHYYAAELKQFAPEAALAMVIVAAVGAFGRVVLRTEAVTRRHVIGFASVLGLAAAGSYSALIVLGGAVGALIVLLALKRRWRAVTLAALTAAPALCIGVLQVLLRRRFPYLRNQDDFFPNGFPPADPSPGDLLRWLPDMWQSFVLKAIAWNHPWFVLALVVAGLVSLVVRGRRLWAGIIVGVLAAAVGAAAVHGLPLEGRVALYLIAPTVIAVVAAIDGTARAVVFSIRRWSGMRARATAAVAAGTVLMSLGTGIVLAVTPAATATYREVTHPRYRDDGRDMLGEVATRLRPGDVVLAYYFSKRLMNWYGPGYDLPTMGLATLTTAGACRPDSVDAALGGARRVWYVSGGWLSTHPRDYTDRVVAELSKRGTIVESSTRWRVSSWTLVDLTAGPDPNPPTPGPDPAYECVTVDPLPRA